MAWEAIRASGASGPSSERPERSTTSESTLHSSPGALVRSVGTPRAWDPEVIDQAIPELPKAVPNSKRTAGEPPVELEPEALEVFRGEKPKLKDTGEINRSSSLVKI